MNTKETNARFVAVLVDGGSEIKCLGPTLSSLFDRINPNIDVKFPAMFEDGGKDRGDITSKNGINPKTVAGCINKLYIDPFLAQNGHITPNYISEIIHIIDMDGAYIDDANIKLNPDNKKYTYRDKTLFVPNINDAIKRNERKRKVVDYLYEQSYIINGPYLIPYSIYFFSSNLDHVLSGNANIETAEEKISIAESFADQYEDNPEGFLKAIESLPGTLKGMTYEETWNYIRMRNSNSIDAHTNINLLLRRLIN